MRVLLLVAGLVIILCEPVVAELATEDQAWIVAENWLHYVVYETGDWAESEHPRVVEQTPIVVSDTLVGWIHRVWRWLRPMPGLCCWIRLIGSNSVETARVHR